MDWEIQIKPSNWEMVRFNKNEIKKVIYKYKWIQYSVSMLEFQMETNEIIVEHYFASLHCRILTAEIREWNILYFEVWESDLKHR